MLKRNLSIIIIVVLTILLIVVVLWVFENRIKSIEKKTDPVILFQQNPLIRPVEKIRAEFMINTGKSFYYFNL